jgi:hypothetical protein
VVLLASAAGAGTLTTSPINAGFGGAVTGVSCSVANVGKKDLDVLIEVIDGIGGTPVSQTYTLQPEGSIGETHFAPGFFFCRFSFKGSNKQVRASAQGIDDDFGTFSSEPAR